MAPGADQVRGRRAPRRVRLAVALTVAAAAALTAPGPARASPAQASPSQAIRPERPNIVFVLTDDLDVGGMEHLPLTRALIGEAGATFTRNFVNVSLCCPSRTTNFRGQYAHNTGVENNGDNGVNGGYQAFLANDLESDTIATRLQAAGYRTALIGKYLNGYPGATGPRYVPPGWSTWASAVAGNPYDQYRYTLNVDGRLKRFGSAREDYGATVQRRMADRFMERASAARAPFFLYLSLYAPHDPAIPAPGDDFRHAGAVAPRTPAFDQPDVSGMPQHVRDLPRLTASRIAEIDALHRLRLASLAGVDRTVAGLVDTLTRIGQLDNTYLVFTSDNGYHLGLHRMPAGKQTPYDSDTNVPLLVRGPGIAPGTRIDALTGNVDYVPTFLTMAGVRVPRYVDGRSFLGLAASPGPTSRIGWRTGFLLEHWRERGLTPTNPPTVRSPTDERPDLDQRSLPPPAGTPVADAAADGSGGARIVRTAFFDALNGIPDYVGVRTATHIYVEYVTGERELYDVRTDPDQIRNLASDPATAMLRRVLSMKLAELARCRGRACHRADRVFPD